MVGKVPGTHKTLTLVGKENPNTTLWDTLGNSTKTLHGISSGAAGMRSSGSPSPQDLLAKPCHSLYTSFASTEPNNISEV